MYSESSNVINFVTGTVKRLRDNIRSKDGKPARMDDIRKGEFLECPQILENQNNNNDNNQTFTHYHYHNYDPFSFGNSGVNGSNNNHNNDILFIFGVFLLVIYILIQYTQQ